MDDQPGAILASLLKSYGLDTRAVLCLREGAQHLAHWVLALLDEIPVALLGGREEESASAIVSALSPEEAPLQRFVVTSEGEIKGCFVSGARVALLFEHLASEEALDLAVRAVEEAGGEVLAVLVVVDFSRQASRYPRRALISRPAPPAAQEPEIVTEISARTWSPQNRSAYRLRMDLKVNVRGSHLLFSARTHDLSRGGLFLATEAELAEGQQLSLHLTLPGGGKIVCKGKVKWRRPEGVDAGPPGVGVEFLNLSRSAQQAIDDLLLRYQHLAFPGEFPFTTGEFPRVPHLTALLGGLASATTQPKPAEPRG
jgi:uncharacterized protein (TIGR02266 family)